MDDSIAHPPSQAGTPETPVWKTTLCLICAFGLAIIMLVAGIWKATDPIGTAARLSQVLIPPELTTLGAISLGISETFAGVLLLVPRFRRWGGLLSAVLLVGMLIYMSIQYDSLAGEECNCFPWIKRAVGPGFIIGDLIMLLMAVIAAAWSRPSYTVRSAALVLAAVCVFSGVSYGIAVTQQTGAEVAFTIEAGGETVPLDEGKILLYFFDPECTSCLWAAEDMSGFTFNDVKVVAIPTVNPQFGTQFLETAKLRAALSPDVERLRETFSFGDPPYAVAVEDGQVVATLTVFEEGEPKASLQRIGFVN